MLVAVRQNTFLFAQGMGGVMGEFIREKTTQKVITTLCLGALMHVYHSLFVKTPPIQIELADCRTKKEDITGIFNAINIQFKNFLMQATDAVKQSLTEQGHSKELELNLNNLAKSHGELSSIIASMYTCNVNKVQCEAEKKEQAGNVKQLNEKLEKYHGEIVELGKDVRKAKDETGRAKDETGRAKDDHLETERKCGIVKQAHAKCKAKLEAYENKGFASKVFCWVG